MKSIPVYAMLHTIDVKSIKVIIVAYKLFIKCGKKIVSARAKKKIQTHK